MSTKNHLPADPSRLGQGQKGLLAPLGRQLVDADHLAALTGAEDVEFQLACAWAADAERCPAVFDVRLFAATRGLPSGGGRQVLCDDDVGPEDVCGNGFVDLRVGFDAFVQSIHRRTRYQEDGTFVG